MAGPIRLSDRLPGGPMRLRGLNGMVLFVIETHLSRRFRSDTRHPNAPSGRCDLWRPQFRDHAQDVGEEISWNGHLRHLEGYVTGVADDLRANLDQLFAQRRHRPVLDRLRRRQRAQEVPATTTAKICPHIH